MSHTITAAPPTLSGRALYHALAVAAVAMACGRIFGVVPPVLGDNDRSRWATVRALVDHGTYAIGHRERDTVAGWYSDRGIIAEHDWKTIDKVLRPDTQEFYSSKPPLLATLVAGEYWVLKQAFGWSITKERGPVVRVILLTVNGLPLLAYLLLLTRLVEGLGRTDWGRIYVVTAACFGTFLTTFATTLNNHTVAACGALFTLYSFLRIWSKRPGSGKEGPDAESGRQRLGGVSGFAACGFFAGWTACNEMPAVLFAAALALLLLRWAPRRTLFIFVPAAALPVAAFLLTNYLAIGQIRPAYMEGSESWYQFEGSYWGAVNGEPVRVGLDAAGEKETKLDYAFHLLEGHHGIFSLSPIYLLAGVGVLFGVPRREDQVRHDASSGEDDRIALNRLAALRVINGLTLLLTVALLAFYISRTNNYGGWTSGPRWFFWLTPLWLLAMLPIADQLSASRWGRGLAYILLAVSVFSASYPGDNPWHHPWLFDFLKWCGYLPY
jgi:hypothetical protein